MEQEVAYRTKFLIEKDVEFLGCSKLLTLEPRRRVNRNARLNNNLVLIALLLQMSVGQAGVQATLCKQLLSNREEKEAKQAECHYVVGR
jgi:hypothetical protein